MKNIRCYEVGDEVYPLRDRPPWNQGQRATVVGCTWEIIGDDPLQLIEVQLPIGLRTFSWSSEVEPVAVRSADLAGIPELPR